MQMDSLDVTVEQDAEPPGWLTPRDELSQNTTENSESDRLILLGRYDLRWDEARGHHSLKWCTTPQPTERTECGTTLQPTERTECGTTPQPTELAVLIGRMHGRASGGLLALTGTNPLRVYKLCVVLLVLLAVHPLLALIFVCLPDDRDMDPVSITAAARSSSNCHSTEHSN